jgi:CheY-like chemotaxis protein/MinD-like ATPase involved in chromosome partitioning or flagellar assembly
MPKALVIDDEASLTAIVKRFLDGAGFETETAVSGPEGLHKAVSVQCDVVIVDIMMPDMDGYEVCRRLCRDPRSARASILALTARGQPIDKQMAFQAGAEGHIAKPFNGKELVQEAQRLLDERSFWGRPAGFQILVLRLKERTGATTLIANLAPCLAQYKGCLSAIAELDPARGAIVDRLGLPAQGPWAQLLPNDRDGLAARLARHESGLFVLPALAPEAAAWVLEALRGWHDYVLLDTPLKLGSLATVLLRTSSLVLLVVTPEPAALWQAQASVEAIERAGGSSLLVWPVLNMATADDQSWQQAAERSGLPVAAVLPWSPEECNRAVAQRTPVVLGQPGSALAAAFQSLADRIVEATGLERKERLGG